MQMLLILCDDISITYKKNKNAILFVFHKPVENTNTFCSVKNVPDYIAKKILPMEEWI